jgi:hypothetical protein
VRIVFLAQDPLDWWSMHSLYEACRDDPRFEAHVVSIGFGPWQGVSTDCDALFARLGLSAVDGVAEPNALRDLSPDVVVLTSPYDLYRHREYHADRLARAAKIVYIPYGIDFGDRTGRMAAVFYGQPLVRRAWRIFTSSPDRVKLWAQRAGVARRCVVGRGLPVIDQTHAAAHHPPLPTPVLAAAGDRFTVLYTPHHSIDDWSTFREHGATMRRLLDEHDDWFLLFRPHPALRRELERVGDVSGRAYEEYFGTERAYFDDSDDFFASLAAADALVSDASSMLFHFAPTDKPIVYLDRSEGAGLDELAAAYVEKACYVARTATEIEAALVRLSQGDDPLAHARRQAHRSGVPLVTADGAGRRIRDHLAKALA